VHPNVKLDHITLAVGATGACSAIGMSVTSRFKVEFEVPCGGSCGWAWWRSRTMPDLHCFWSNSTNPVLSGQSSCTIQITDVDTLFQRPDRFRQKLLPNPGSNSGDMALLSPIPTAICCTSMTRHQ